MAAVIRGAQAEKVAQTPLAPPAAPPAAAQAPADGTVTPQHLRMASSIAPLGVERHLEAPERPLFGRDGHGHEIRGPLIAVVKETVEAVYTVIQYIP